ncbi:MAG TPA: DUF2652 domain-containing protein [Cytophagaceae bacterium]|jgi:hypothetical protein
MELKTNSSDDVMPALFYIPDISGFTEFINSTNIGVSKNLIHDLLESIIDSNILNLKINEIQGDAILFYHLGTPFNISKIESQAKKTFQDFQRSLRSIADQYCFDNSCNNLTLKIIVHYGLASPTLVKGILKLMGSDVILAHRLLKNNIQSHEYLLLTESYLETQEPKLLDHSFAWGEMKTGEDNYDHFGPVGYKYISLTPLKKTL